MGMKLLALGDSYTIGESVDQSDSFPYLWKDALKASAVRVVAKTGWTTSDLIQGIFQSDLEAQYDRVSLLIGVNNQYQGKSRQSYQIEFNQLLDLAIAKVSQPDHLLVLSIPNYGVTPFGKKWKSYISADLEKYNQTAKEQAQKRGIRFINITEASLKASSDLSLLASDGLHPSGKMYAEWVKMILK